MWSAMRAAIRILLRNPGFALVSVLAIGLGVSLNTACYSLIRAVLLKPLPYRDPGQLVYIWETHPRFPNMAVAMPDYLDWRDLKSFDGVAAYTIQTMNRGILHGQGAPAPVQSVMASHELLPLLGVQPLIGRLLSAEDERGKRNVAILSERLWRARFNADPGVLGRSLRLDQSVFTIIGVVGDRWSFPAWADLWMPLSLIEPQLQDSRKFHTLEVVARLKQGVSHRTAHDELAGVMSVLAAQFPVTNGNEGATVVPMQHYQTAEVRDPLLLVWAAVGLVLLIVSVNVAHLVMARAAGRERELAIRVALGATRAQIARLLFLENSLLAICGGVVGLGLALALMPVLSRYAASVLPRFEPLALDGGVIAYALLAVSITLVLFALPALWSSFRPSLRTAMGVSGSRAGRLLVGVEIALAFAVLCGAGILIRGFGRVLAIDPGFDSRNVIAMNVMMPRPAYDWEKSRLWFEQTLAPKLRGIPGVRFVANANVLPLTLPGMDQIHRFATRFGVPGETYADGAFPIAQTRWVSEDYFRALGIQLKHGRFLAESDRGLQRHLVNETLARRYYGGTNAVGKQLIFGMADPRKVAVEIVGVVADVRDLSLELPPEPTIYSLGTSMQFALLVSGEGVQAETIAGTIRELEPEALVERAGGLDRILTESVARRRFSLELMSGFGLIAALLAALGVFGVVSYTAGRRVKEFGVRMALGARPAHVRKLILFETMIVAVAGVLAGGILSRILAPLSRSLAYDVPAWDPVSLGATALVLVVASLLAAWIPAARASRLDPSIALRTDA